MPEDGSACLVSTADNQTHPANASTEAEFRTPLVHL
jgi:hypothetical protein